MCLIVGCMCSDKLDVVRRIQLPLRCSVTMSNLLGNVMCGFGVIQVGGQAVLGRQLQTATPWLTERHGYDPTCRMYVQR